MNEAWIDQAAERIAAAARAALSIKEGAQEQLREAIAHVLRELDVASREEVKELEAMLVRAREELAQLEARVAALEDAARSSER